MIKQLIVLACLTASISCLSQVRRDMNFPHKIEPAGKLPEKNNVWVFVMAGQSNMAGRGLVEPQDTISTPRIITLTKDNMWLVAKEPLHLYEADKTGLDCGLSFASELTKHLKDSIVIALVPCAIGGSSVQQWLGDSLHRNVHLLTNFKEKVDVAKQYGIIKGILWHQGESDGHPGLVTLYENKLEKLIGVFREHIGDSSLPVYIAELGSYAQPKETQDNWNKINDSIHELAKRDKRIFIVNTNDLRQQGDNVHFNSFSQRTMGERFAKKVMKEVLFH